MLRHNNILLYLLLCISYLLLTAISNKLLDIEELVKTSLAEKLSSDELTKVLNYNKKIAWVNYVIIPIFLLIKVSLIALILDIGAFLFDKEIKYRDLFNIVVIAEFIFLLVIVFKTMWFLFYEKKFSIDDIQNYYPLSALSIIGDKNIDPWYIYPLQVINIFEIAYITTLAIMIDKILHIGYNKNTGLKIVLSSYGISLIIWVGLIMFILLNIY